MRIHQLTAAAIPIALLLGGCGDRQEEARNAADESTASARASRNRLEEPAELSAAVVEAHAKTMVERLGDVEIVEASPGRFTGTGSRDGRVYQIAVLRDGSMTRYELESEGAEGRKTIQETVWSDGSSTETTRETLLKTPDGETSTQFSSSSSVRGEPAYRATPAYQEHLRKMEERDRKMEEMRQQQEQKSEENP